MLRILCLVLSLSFAVPAIGLANVEFTEEDGSPTVWPWQVKVTNGTLTDNGDGTASISTGGGGGGSGDITDVGDCATGDCDLHTATFGDGVSGDMLWTFDGDAGTDGGIGYDVSQDAFVSDANWGWGNSTNFATADIQIDEGLGRLWGNFNGLANGSLIWEGDTDANLFYVNALYDAVAIGSSAVSDSSARIVQITSASKPILVIGNETANDPDDAGFRIVENADSSTMLGAYWLYENDNDLIRFGAHPSSDVTEANDVDSFQITLADSTVDFLTSVDFQGGVEDGSLAVADLGDVNAGTDLTADLEEEAHASEHQDGGADEVAVTTGMMNAGTGASSATFWRGDNTWATPAGSGDVSKVGTPVDNQIGVWTGDGTIEGDTALTFDTSTDTLSIVGTLEVDGLLDLDWGGTLTVATGAVTVTNSYHYIDTEGAAGTDDLDTISGGASNEILILQSLTSGRDTTVKHGTGNITLANGQDFVLSDTNQRLVLASIGGSWYELSRSKPTHVLEADISDLAHTSDTNANTICTGTGNYLDGEGNCDALTTFPGFTDIDTDYGNETVTSTWNFIDNGTGALGVYDLQVGDVTTPDYGGIQLGGAGIYRTSAAPSAMDFGGAILIRNEANLDVGNDPGIEFALMEGGNTVRFAIPESGAGNATAMFRSVTIGGAYSQVSGNAQMTCAHWSNYDSNIDCDTGGTGPDLFVKDDFEVEGNIYSSGSIFGDADDANQHQIAFANATADRVFTLPDDQIASGDLIVGNGAGTFAYTAKSAIALSDFNVDLASTDLSDTAAILYETELDTFTELQTQIADETLLKAGTLTDGQYCIYDSASTDIICNSTPGGSGDITDVGSCASGDCDLQTVTFGDGVSGNIVWTFDGDAGVDGTITWDVTNDYFSTAKLAVADEIYHAADTNTYIDFLADSIEFYAGGADMILLQETTQNVIYLNPNQEDIDIEMYTSTNPLAFVLNAGTDALTLGVSTATVTGDWDFSGGGIEIENGTTPPACTEGQLFLDTDATAGQQLMACDGGTFVTQGDGGGAETNDLEANDPPTIADTEIYVGNGAGSGTFVAVSGDATLANTGALTLAANSVDSDEYVDGSIDAAHYAGDIETRSIGITIDGGGSAITTGVKGYVEVPYACTISRNTVLLDQSGSIVIDVWKDTYANYPPTDADSITASAPPTVTTATKSQDATLTGWTTSVSAGDVLGFNVDSITTAERAHLVIKCDMS